MHIVNYGIPKAITSERDEELLSERWTGDLSPVRPASPLLHHLPSTGGRIVEHGDGIYEACSDDHGELSLDSYSRYKRFDPDPKVYLLANRLSTQTEYPSWHWKSDGKDTVVDTLSVSHML